jgi:hypothetical protein
MREGSEFDRVLGTPITGVAQCTLDGWTIGAFSGPSHIPGSVNLLP